LLLPAGDLVQKHHMLQDPVRMLYNVAGAGAVKTLSKVVNVVDGSSPGVIGGAAAAYALASPRSDTIKI
jgi:hypothetical protein